MPTSYQGDGRVYGSTVYAGIGVVGSVTVDGVSAAELTEDQFFFGPFLE